VPVVYGVMAAEIAAQESNLWGKAMLSTIWLIRHLLEVL